MPNDQSLAQIFKVPTLGAAIEIALIILAAMLLAGGTARVLAWIATRVHGKRRLRVLALVPALRLLIVIAAFVAIVPLLIEPSVQNMVALFGALGLALGFAMKDYASSLIAGVVAVGEMPYRNGDWVKIDGIYGEVRAVGMRTVRLVTPDDDVVTIPQSRLWNAAIFNSNDGSPRLQCVATFQLHPDADEALAREVLIDVGLTSAYVHFEQPVVVVMSSQPWGTELRLKAYPVDARQQFRFITDLTVRGKAALRLAGLRFCSWPGTAMAAD